MTFRVVSSDDERGTASLEYVRRFIETAGHDVVNVPLPNRAKRLSRQSRRIQNAFQHTPEPLLDSWRVARQLSESTDPGDVVLMSDHRGLGGIFALAQAAADPEQRRRVWTIAADSAYLELRFIAGVHEGLPLPLDSQVDWEIVQYHWSDRVIATSWLAVRELARLGVGAELVGASEPAAPIRGSIDSSRVWAPGPVSRRNQSGEVLRAMTSIPAAGVLLSAEDDDDRIWTGTTWEALRHSRDVLGPRVQRGEAARTPSVIVLGDPFAPPVPSVAGFRDQGVPVVVPEASVAQAVWPDTRSWRTADDLTRILTERDYRFDNTSSDRQVTLTPTPAIEAPERGVAVSVGIPVFRDVRFLAECVESLLGQEQQPLEVVLIDDGSDSREVERAFESLESSHPVVRTMITQHRGVCSARNAALETFAGDSFVFVDSDDILLPDFLSRCSQVLRAREDVWAVATWTEFLGEYEAIEAKPPFDERVGMRENPIVSTCVLVEMKARDAGIRFAPDLAFLFCEDWHFWSQITAAGGRFGLVPEPLVQHRVHTSSGGFLRTELAHAIGKSRAIEPLLQRPT
jgi:GT2 family glycosyltransferase